MINILDNKFVNEISFLPNVAEIDILHSALDLQSHFWS